MQRSEKIKCVAYHYGMAHQSKKAIEEMSELTKALCKIDGVPAIDPKNEMYLIDVIEEIADVIVMMEQLKLFFGQKQIEDTIDLKIDRQIERICMGRD